jgi:hypothetical protein
MSMCSICGAEPCTNPTSCAAYRKAGHRLPRAERPYQYWHASRLIPTLAHFDRKRRMHGAPYQALLRELRTHGLAQLNNPNCRQRLGELSSVQLRELIAALARLQPKYPAITDELIKTLQRQLHDA